MRTSKLWPRIELYVNHARELESLKDVTVIGVDETSLRRGQDYITVVHDIEHERLLFATERRAHQKVLVIAADLALCNRPSAHHACLPQQQELHFDRRSPNGQAQALA